MNIYPAFLFILDTLFNLFLTIILLRVILQYVKAPYYNPISQFIINLTNFGFKPLRRFIPGFMGIDFAGLVFALLFALTYYIVLGLLNFGAIANVMVLLVTSIFVILSTTLTIFFWSIILRVILSFVNVHQLSQNPLYSIVFLITEPVLRPIRNIIPPISGFDLSPLFACLMISVIRIMFNLF